MPSKHVLPRPNFDDAATQAWAMRLVDVMQRAIDDLSIAPRVGIVLTNVSPVSTFDPTTATLLQTAQAFSTALQAFQRAGRVS